MLLTCVDEELVGDSRVIDVMNSASKDGRQYLKVSEDILKVKQQ